MNEEELKKEIEKWSRGCNVNIDFPKGLKYCDGINLCKVCKTNLDLYEAELKGFQKGKLEQKKEELRFLKERCIYCMIADERIKQLQKEIHSQQNPTQSNGSMNNGLGTSSADTKEIGEEKQDEN